MMNEPKKLYRSRDDRMVSGLCAGIGKYIDIDPTVVRVVYIVASILSGGLPIIIYLVLIMVVPEEPISGPGLGGDGVI
jgi:phage shock protein PspC (stress-responsive transcriptional regulator)